MTDATVQERCIKCLFPMAAPGGQEHYEKVCQACHTGFPNYQPKGEEALLASLEKYRGKGCNADLLVAVSGGKDSCFSLWKLATDYRMRVEAFTYYHDAHTDLAMQNAKNVCKDAGVRHHIVALPRHIHLRLFRSFFTAWVHHPDPVTAAMVCVGCKYMHILGKQLAKQRGIPVIIWSATPLEAPYFLPTRSTSSSVVERKSMVGLGIDMMRKMMTDYRFLTAVLSHLPTCFFGCIAYHPDTKYLRLRFRGVENLHFFEYYPWNAKVIREDLETRTHWRRPVDSPFDWHSDCLIDVYKEYMFQTMLGVSYTDGHISNQIRTGLLSYQEGLQDLKESKEHYRQACTSTLAKLGLQHLQDKINPSCFSVFESTPEPPE